MYRNILIPVLLDTETSCDASFAAALALADPGATLTVIHVQDPVPTYTFGEFPTDFMVQVRADTTKALKKAATRLPGATAELVLGHAGRGILDYADTHNNDCIIVASHRAGLADYFLGSTASHVVRHAKCCVHVLR